VLSVDCRATHCNAAQSRADQRIAMPYNTAQSPAQRRELYSKSEPSTMRFRRLHPVELAFHLAPFIVAALIAAGCQNGQATVTREGLSRASQPIIAEHWEWTQALAGVPGHTLPRVDAMTPTEKAGWLDARHRWHDRYEKYLSDSRSRDAGVPTTQP
jgi:hypothetical protein